MQEGLGLGHDLLAGAGREGREGFDRHLCRGLGALDLPGARGKAVHEHGGRDAQGREEDPGPIALGDESLVGAGGDEVVVLRDEAYRGCDIARRPGRLGQVEELLALLVAEGDELRPQRFEAVTQAAHPRPGLGIGDTRRPIGRQVAKDQMIGSGHPVARDGAPQPPFGEREARLGGEPPGRARFGDLDQGHEHPNRVSHRPLVAFRKGDLELLAKLLEGLRLRRQDGPRLGHESLEFHDRALLAEDRLHSRLQYWLEGRAQGHEVLGRDEVQGAAERRGPHHQPPLEQIHEVRALEALDATPEAEKRRPGPLGLHRHQALDRLQGCRPARGRAASAAPGWRG